MSDDQGLIELLSHNLDYFRAKPVNIPKITILLDHGYHPDQLTLALQAHESAGDDQDPISTCSQTHKSRKSGTRKNGICPSGNAMGYRTVECLDGTM